MPFQVTNRSSGPVLIRLRSGGTLHLVTGEQSPGLAESEVSNNARVESLVQRGLITVREVPARTRTKSAREKAPAAGRRRKDAKE